MTRLEALKYLMENLGVKKTFIEDYCGLTRNTLNNYFRGTSHLEQHPQLEGKIDELLENYNIKENE